MNAVGMRSSKKKGSVYLMLGAALKKAEMRSWGRGRGREEAGKGEARAQERGPRQDLATVLRVLPRGVQGKPVLLSSGILHRPGDKQAAA